MTLQRIAGPPPITNVPEGATVLIERQSISEVAHNVLSWTWIDYGPDEDPPTLDNWYENERGISGNSDVIAHYRLSPPEWAAETNG